MADVVDCSDGDWNLLLVSQRTKVGTLPDINEPVYVITRVVLLPLNQTSARDLDITVC